MAIVGIDLGTTNSLIAVFKDGKSMLIPNQFGEYLTPSVVNMDDNGKIIVGKIARERLISEPERTASLFKRAMGTKVTVMLGNKVFQPEELSSFIIRQLCMDAEKFLGEKIEEAVISVPAYFDVSQRAATKKAGNLAGIKVERLINEPSAAALSCHKENMEESFVVFDFGGGTLDVSVVECFDNIISISAICGDNHLGGSDFDEIIAREMCNINGVKYDKLSVGEKESLLRLSEKAKIELQNKREVELVSHLSNCKRSMTLTNELLFELCSEIFDKIKKPIKQAIYDSDIQSDEIQKFILVGGSCHLDLVKDYLTEILNVEIVNSEDVDTMVARGLGIYVGIMERKEEVKKLLLTDICPFSLCTSVYNDKPPYYSLSSVIIKRNSILPKSVSRYYSPAHKDQIEMNFYIYQGENVYAKDNKELSVIRVKLPENNIDDQTIKVTFTYDINALLGVEIEILSTGKIISMIYNGYEWENSKSALRKNDEVKSMIINNTMNKEYDLTIERAKRVYAESDMVTQEYLEKVISQYFQILNSNNIHNIVSKTKEFNGILDNIEYLKEEDNIFR